MSREWSFEVGIADRVGRKGIIRFSTFQKQPRLKVPADSNGLPLLHLPFSFPSDSTQLTAWSTEIFKHIYKPGEKNLKPKIRERTVFRAVYHWTRFSGYACVNFQNIATFL
ncbi:transcription factor iib [Lentinula edodes]|uniref:Transcription factor iib n=1 Tax=Lentinula edodes TaxID=5353 RepID=A0A1Q3EP15_LENED|nr:transcription factor iib [Lentinula edodes]